jgi:hypothetical protein
MLHERKKDVDARDKLGHDVEMLVGIREFG